MTPHSGYWVKGNRITNRTEAKLAPLDNEIVWTIIKYYSYSDQGWVMAAIRVNCGDVASVDEHETKAGSLDYLRWLNAAYRDYYLLAAEDELSGFMIAIDEVNPNGTPPSWLTKPVKRSQSNDISSNKLCIVPLFNQ